MNVPEHESADAQEAADEIQEATQDEAADVIRPEEFADAEPAADLDPNAKVAEANDRALRAHAELENYRRRAQRELSDALKYANAGLVRELLPVLDNLNRAIEAATPSEENQALLEGVKMVAQQFLAALGKHGCTKVEALHAPFDPNVHEALSKIPSEEHPAMTVIHEMLPGFVLHDRVVRPSQVVVSAGPPAESEEE